MEQLQHPLAFVHKFNLYKLSGLLIEDEDLPSIDSLQLDDQMHISVLSLDEYKRNIRFITETLIEKGKSLIQVTIPPVDNPRLQSYFAEGNYLYTGEHIGQVNDFIRDWAMAKGSPVADLARAVREQNADVLEPDGLHLSGRGQVMLSKLLLELLP